MNRRLEKALEALARTQRQFEDAEAAIWYGCNPSPRAEQARRARDAALLEVLAAYGELLEARDAEGPPTAAPELLAVLRSLADAAESKP